MAEAPWDCVAAAIRKGSRRHVISQSINQLINLPCPTLSSTQSSVGSR